MVNENLTPKTEMVYELKEKYQVPTFAEFMKTYQPNETSELITEVEYQDWVLYGPQYGSGFLGDFLRLTLGGAPPLPAAASKPLLNSPTTRFENKVAITTITGAALGPASIPVGAAVWGGSRAVQELTDNDDAKKVFGFVGDIGRDTFTGGVVGVAAQGVGAILGGKEILSFGGKSAKELEKILRQTTSNAGFAKAMHFFAAAENGMNVSAIIEFWTSKGIEATEVIAHIGHKCDGIEHKVGCKVCES